MRRGRIAGRRAGALPRDKHGPRVSLQELRPLHVVRSRERRGPGGPGLQRQRTTHARHRVQQRTRAGQSHVAGVGQRGRYMETLPVAAGRFRDCRRGAGRHRGGRLRGLRRSFHVDAGPAWSRRTGRRLVADRELHRLPGRAERARSWPPAASCKCSSSGRGSSRPSTSRASFRPNRPARRTCCISIAVPPSTAA